ncbi:MAG: GNAT family N-acetyltransferase [Burkholderiales bacterium]|jgi:N-acetylglutamate synthase-like GNAT family acetyltransferase
MSSKDNRNADLCQSQLRIVAFTTAHAEAFRELNLDWIERYFVVEELDRRQLSSPREHFIDPGGAIFIAELDGVAVGCCGLLRHGKDVYEVSKMAVRDGYRGCGIGGKLLDVVIAHARKIGASQLEIISSTRLAAAIALYKARGFVEVPLASDAYARGNIALVLQLDEAA